MLNQTERRLINAIKQRTKNKWISVKDGTPKNERVIAFTPNEDESLRYRFIPANMFKQVASEATHWMYIPLEPKD